MWSPKRPFGHFLRKELGNIARKDTMLLEQVKPPRSSWYGKDIKREFISPMFRVQYPIADRLVTKLWQHRTVALGDGHHVLLPWIIDTGGTFPMLGLGARAHLGQHFPSLVVVSDDQEAVVLKHAEGKMQLPHRVVVQFEYVPKQYEIADVHSALDRDPAWSSFVQDIRLNVLGGEDAIAIIEEGGPFPNLQDCGTDIWPS
jgi:hypothetical protein